MKCPYCSNDAEWVENKAIYGRNYGKSYMMYLCRPCDARVGCHTNSRKPLGTMADKELREWRMKAHAYIDPLHLKHGWSRRGVYNYLNKVFGREMHIGESDIQTCKQILATNFPKRAE